MALRPSAATAGTMTSDDDRGFSVLIAVATVLACGVVAFVTTGGFPAPPVAGVAKTVGADVRDWGCGGCAGSNFGVVGCEGGGVWADAVRVAAAGVVFSPATAPPPAGGGGGGGEAATCDKWLVGGGVLLTRRVAGGRVRGTGDGIGSTTGGCCCGGGCGDDAGAVMRLLIFVRFFERKKMGERKTARERERERARFRIRDRTHSSPPSCF